MTYFRSLTLKNLPPYTIGHIAEAVNAFRIKGEDIIDCSQLNPIEAPPQAAIDRLVQYSLLPHNHRYTSSAGINALREAFAFYYNKSFNVEGINSATEIAVTQGTKEGITALLKSILSPGDTALVPVPAYPLHTAAVALSGAGFVGVPLWKDYQTFSEARGKLTSESEYFFERLANRYSQTWPRPKVIITSFPHNPTGSVVTECFYERLIEFARSNKLIIINDFAHGDLYYNKKDTVSLLSNSQKSDLNKQQLVELYSLSKGFSLAGWRVGAALGDADIISSLKAVISYTSFGIFQPIQLSASKLLIDEANSSFNNSYIEDVRSNLSSKKELVLSSLNDLGWGTMNSLATPLLWASLPEKFKGLDSFEACKIILEKCRVAILPGQGFDPEQKNNVRISLNETELRLREGMSRISKLSI